MGHNAPNGVGSYPTHSSRTSPCEIFLGSPRRLLPCVHSEHRPAWHGSCFAAFKGYSQGPAVTWCVPVPCVLVPSSDLVPSALGFPQRHPCHICEVGKNALSLGAWRCSQLGGCKALLAQANLLGSPLSSPVFHGTQGWVHCGWAQGVFLKILPVGRETL